MIGHPRKAAPKGLAARSDGMKVAPGMAMTSEKACALPPALELTELRKRLATLEMLERQRDLP